MTITTEATADTTETRIKSLEKRLSQIEYKRTPAAPAADLTFRRADAADVWLAVDPAGNTHTFIAYFGERAVPTGKHAVLVPTVLVAGEIRGDWFVPYDDQFPSAGDPDYAGLATVEAVSIGG